MLPILIITSTVAGLWALHENDKADAVREAHLDGERKGNIETKKLLIALQEEREKYAKGAYALAVHVANLDGIISPEEDDELQKVIGEINKKIHGEGMVNALQKIYYEKPSFSTICDRYFNIIDFNNPDDRDYIKRLDNMVRGIIYAAYVDGEVPDGSAEDRFYNEMWLPFKEKGYYTRANSVHYGYKSCSSSLNKMIEDTCNIKEVVTTESNCTVLDVFVKNGEEVKTGDDLFEIEYNIMNMSISTIRVATCSGIVDSVKVYYGKKVDSGDVLLTIAQKKIQ